MNYFQSQKATVRGALLWDEDRHTITLTLQSFTVSSSNRLTHNPAHENTDSHLALKNKLWQKHELLSSDFCCVTLCDPVLCHINFCRGVPPLTPKQQ